MKLFVRRLLFSHFAPRMAWRFSAACLLGLLVLPVFGQEGNPSDFDSQDFNVRRKAEIMQQVNVVLNKYRGYLFNDWMSCGREEDFRKRVYDSDVQIYIDLEYLGIGKDEAAYVDSYIPKQYVNDLILRTEPRFIEPILLWHEVIHAISDDKELFTHKASNANDQDHHYIEWAESIIRTGLPKLAELETIMKKYGSKQPPDDELQKGQECWKQFMLSYNRGNLKPIPNEKEQKELRDTCGFYCDPERIMKEYIQLGYSPEYFAKPIKLSFFPNAVFDVTIHPGDTVEIKGKVRDITTMKPPLEGQIRFEYQLTQGVWSEIGESIVCPCQEIFSREWTPEISDPAQERVFPIKVAYDYGHRAMPGSPFIAGRVRVVPWERSLHLKFVEKGQPEKMVPGVKVRFVNAKVPDQTAPNGEVLIKNLKPMPSYTLEITAPGYERRVINNVPLPAVRTKTEADTPKPLTIELESTTKPTEAPGDVKVSNPSGKSSNAPGAMLKPIPAVSLGLKVDPDKYSYEVGDKVTFIQDVQNLNPKNTYTYEWHVDGKPAGKGKTCSHTFTKPGRHYVQLVLTSSDPKENDAIIKNISVEYPPDMDVKIAFIPETNVYAIGTSVGFEAKVKNATGITEYRWYVAGEYVGSGKQGVKHKFTEAGEFEIKLGLRMGSNFDEVKVTRTLVVGEAAIGTLGRERNRFEATGAPENLVIKSSYWKGGTAEWSKPVTFNGGDIGAVDHYILYDGEQADGYNTGYLVYVPRGRNSLLFKVFHFRWPDRLTTDRRDPHGFVHYSGPLPLHNETLVPESVQFTRRASRLCEVEWRTRDGSSCRARINKFKKSDKIRFSGIEDLGCQDGVYPPTPAAGVGAGAPGADPKPSGDSHEPGGMSDDVGDVIIETEDVYTGDLGDLTDLEDPETADKADATGVLDEDSAADDADVEEPDEADEEKEGPADGSDADDQGKTDDASWQTASSKGSPHASICPKADQWSTSGGGFMVMNGAHRFDKRWFKSSGGEKNPNVLDDEVPNLPNKFGECGFSARDLFYVNDEDTKSPPRHSYAEVIGHAKIKQGTITVRGPGALAFYWRKKGGAPHTRLYDAATGQSYWPQTGGEQTIHETRNWVFKNGRWEGKWLGDFRGNVSDLHGDRPMSGWVPAGQTKTLEVFVQQGCYHNVFPAPSEIEYELWFFPREGGGVQVTKTATGSPPLTDSSPSPAVVPPGTPTMGGLPFKMKLKGPK